MLSRAGKFSPGVRSFRLLESPFGSALECGKRALVSYLFVDDPLYYTEVLGNRYDRQLRWLILPKPKQPTQKSKQRTRHGYSRSAFLFAASARQRQVGTPRKHSSALQRQQLYKADEKIILEHTVSRIALFPCLARVCVSGVRAPVNCATLTRLDLGRG